MLGKVSDPNFNFKTKAKTATTENKTAFGEEKDEMDTSDCSSIFDFTVIDKICKKSSAGKLRVYFEEKWTEAELLSETDYSNALAKLSQINGKCCTNIIFIFNLFYAFDRSFIISLYFRRVSYKSISG